MLALEERPLISGCSVLDKLNEASGNEDLGIVYHGTPLQLNSIVPKMCRKWLNEQYLPDTDQPVVCASDNPTIAAFRALVPRTQETFGCSRGHNGEGGLTFIVPEYKKTELQAAVGYVSLCDSNEFKLHIPESAYGREPVQEFRSDRPIIPLCNVEIDYTDFEDLLHADSRNRLIYT